MVLETANIQSKIAAVDSLCHALALGEWNGRVPLFPARDVEVMKASELPPKTGLGTPEGQARLLHDLASIELQAMELGLRTLCEFPNAPALFREELIALVQDEKRHLKLCLHAIEALGFSWGHWPVHIALWLATDSSDDLVDRVLIVHRYLEGSGLDAGEIFMKRIHGVANPELRSTVTTIFEEEIGHVALGTKWFREICAEERLDPEEEFTKRLDGFRFRIPKRLEKVARLPRLQAGFTERELVYLEELRFRSGVPRN